LRACLFFQQMNSACQREWHSWRSRTRRSATCCPSRMSASLSTRQRDNHCRTPGPAAGRSVPPSPTSPTATRPPSLAAPSLVQYAGHHCSQGSSNGPSATAPTTSSSSRSLRKRPRSTRARSASMPSCCVPPRSGTTTSTAARACWACTCCTSTTASRCVLPYRQINQAVGLRAAPMPDRS
jgi:hypothetical protein